MNPEIDQLCQQIRTPEDPVLEPLIERAYQPLEVIARGMLQDDRMATYLEPGDLISAVFEALRGRSEPIDNFRAYARKIMANRIANQGRFEGRDKRAGVEDEYGNRMRTVRIDDFVAKDQMGGLS